jgi:hypothetical protein
VLGQDADNFVRWEVLERFPAVNRDDQVRHLRLERPLVICMDALNRRGLIVPAEGQPAG